MGWKLNLAVGAGAIAASLIALAVFKNKIVGAAETAGSTIGTSAGSFVGEIGSSFLGTLQSYLPSAGTPGGAANQPGNIPPPGTPGTTTGNVLVPPPDVSHSLNNDGTPKTNNTPPPATPPPTTTPPPSTPPPVTPATTPGPAVSPPTTKPKSTASPSGFGGVTPGQYGTPIPGVDLVGENPMHFQNAYEYLLHEQSQQVPQSPPGSIAGVNINSSPSQDIFSQIARALQSGVQTIVPGLGSVTPIPRGTIITELA